jgi:hypothetical protein
MGRSMTPLCCIATFHLSDINQGRAFATSATSCRTTHHSGLRHCGTLCRWQWLPKDGSSRANRGRHARINHFVVLHGGLRGFRHRGKRSVVLCACKYPRAKQNACYGPAMIPSTVHYPLRQRARVSRRGQCSCPDRMEHMKELSFIRPRTGYLLFCRLST